MCSGRRRAPPRAIGGVHCSVSTLSPDVGRIPTVVYYCLLDACIQVTVQFGMDTSYTCPVYTHARSWSDWSLDRLGYLCRAEPMTHATSWSAWTRLETANGRTAPDPRTWHTNRDAMGRERGIGNGTWKGSISGSTYKSWRTRLSRVYTSNG